RHGLEFHPEWVMHGSSCEDGDRTHNFVHFFERRGLPEAIVATNDNVAIRLIEPLEARRWRVPDEVSVVGCDGSRVAALHRIGLTTIAQPVEQLAQISVELLLDRVGG